jgi:hypothetical protein
MGVKLAKVKVLTARIQAHVGAMPEDQAGIDQWRSELARLNADLDKLLDAGLEHAPKNESKSPP